MALFDRARPKETPAEPAHTPVPVPVEIVHRMTPTGVDLLRLAREPEPLTIDRLGAVVEACIHTSNLDRACLEVGVLPSQIRAEMARSEEVRSAIDLALKWRVLDAEQAALGRAIEGVEKPIFYQGRPVGSVREFSDSLLAKILESRLEGYERKTKIDGKLALGHTWLDMISRLQESSD